ncbi:hypothetical protein F5882DRAFT_376767 [Hyaloscypha sp. PMI_1271]|nr:hypothetical protein F5882DRAFT_376767 [Hyaloscypha sp. PMI_1271]
MDRQGELISCYNCDEDGYVTCSWPKEEQLVQARREHMRRDRERCKTAGAALTGTINNNSLPGQAVSAAIEMNLADSTSTKATRTVMDIPVLRGSQLKGPSEGQPPTNGPSEDPTPAENLTATTGEAPPKAPPAIEPSTTLSHLGSPSKGQPTTEVHAENQQIAEAPTANQQAEKALRDTPALASLPNGQYATDSPTTNLPDGEILKKPRENPSQVQSAERPSKDKAVKSLPTITAATEARPSSGKQSDVPTADSDQEPQKDLLSNPLSSNTIKDTSQRTNHKANRQKHKREESGKEDRFQPSKRSVTIIDLTSIDSEDESEPSTSDSHYRPSPSPESKIVSGDFDSEQDSERMLGLRATRLAFDSDDDIIEVTSAERPSNSSKRSFRTADDQAISHKRLKMDKDTTLPDSQGNSPHSADKPKTQLKRKTRSKFGERSLRDSINIESGWLDTAQQSSEKFRQLSLERTVQFSKLIELDTEIDKLLNEISIEDRPQQLRKLIERLRSVEERRRGFTDVLYRNVISEYGECNHMKETIEQWILEETKVSKRIERSS